jgi:hypothetical protein
MMLKLEMDLADGKTVCLDSANPLDLADYARVLEAIALDRMWATVRVGDDEYRTVDDIRSVRVEVSL